jgi:ribosomal-protein-alanine N-acetyltransferase
MEATIRLRGWRPSDARWYAAAVRDPEILRWTTEHPGTTAADVRAAIAELPADADAWVVLDGRGRRVGNASIATHDGIAEPAYWVAASARARGVATAVLRELTSRAISMGAARIEVVIASGNAASRRVAEKAGFVEIAVEDHPHLGESVRFRFVDGPAF